MIRKGIHYLSWKLAGNAHNMLLVDIKNNVKLRLKEVQ